MGRRFATSSCALLLSWVLIAAALTPGAAFGANVAGDPRPILGIWKNLPNTWARTGVDAILRWDSKLWYVFKDGKFVNYAPNKGATNKPRSVYGNFKCVPKDFANKISGALHYSGKDYYLFSRDGRYLRYHKDKKACDSRPLPVYKNWKGVPSDFKVSGALNTLNGKNVYLFSDDGRYINYNFKSKGSKPRKITGNWPNLSPNVSAAVAWTKELWYLTSGGAFQSYRVTIPKKIAKCSSCGCENKRPCKLWERVPSCRQGLTEIPGKGCVNLTKAWKSVSKKIGAICGKNGQRGCFPGEKKGVVSCEAGLFLNTKTLKCDIGACGVEGKRPCLVVERVPSCDGKLKEDFVANKCVKSLSCGANGQRPCLIVERIPSCNKGYVENFLTNKCEKPAGFSKTCMEVVTALQKKRTIPLLERLKKEKERAIEALKQKSGAADLLNDVKAEVEKRLKHKKLKPYLGEIDGLAELINEKKEYIERELLAPKPFCNDTLKQRLAKLQKMGFKPDIKLLQKAGLFDNLFIKSAHAAGRDFVFWSLDLIIEGTRKNVKVQIINRIVFKLNLRTQKPDPVSLRTGFAFGAHNSPDKIEFKFGATMYFEKVDRDFSLPEGRIYAPIPIPFRTYLKMAKGLLHFHAEGVAFLFNPAKTKEMLKSKAKLSEKAARKAFEKYKADKAKIIGASHDFYQRLNKALRSKSKKAREAAKRLKASHEQLKRDGIWSDYKKHLAALDDWEKAVKQAEKEAKKAERTENEKNKSNRETFMDRAYVPLVLDVDLLRKDPISLEGLGVMYNVVTIPKSAFTRAKTFPVPGLSFETNIPF